MSAHSFAVIVLRAIGLQLFLVGLALSGEVIWRFATRTGRSLDDEQYVIVTGPAPVVAALLCVVLSLVIVFASTHMARWLSRGLE